MGEAQEGAESDIDLHLGRNDKHDEMQVDASTSVDAVALGNAIPLRVAFWKAASIEREASQIQNLDANRTIIGNGGPVGQKTREEIKEENDKESGERIRDVIALIADEQERQREHEAQWLASSHTYAGQTMDGKQWKALATWFQDPDNMADWEDAMMAKTGQTREEVRTTGGKMKRFYDLMDKDAKGTLKPDERTEFTTLQEDPNLKRGIEIQRQVQGLRAERGHDQTADNGARWDGDLEVRSAAVADRFSDDLPAKGLEAVKSVSPIYNVAASGVEPAPAAPSPTKPIAANTVQMSPDNMFG